MMRSKRLITAFIACAALAAVSASSAQAVVWKTGTTTLSLETVGVSAATTLTLTSTFAGTPVEITASGITCASVGGCHIEGAGHSSGKLKFTGATVVKPAHCTVRGTPNAAGSSEVTTEALEDQLKMGDELEPLATFDEFFPVNVHQVFAYLVFEGALCVFDELELEISGTLVGRTENTGVQKLVQPAAFSAAQQATGGGQLKLGSAVAQLTGTVNNVLTGAHAGAAFGAQ